MQNFKFKNIKSIYNTPKKGFVFLPIAGSDEIGVNCYLYGASDDRGKYKWLIVDSGAGFEDMEYKGIDRVLPNLSVIESIKDDICGLLLTHAHYDHIGGIEYFINNYLDGVNIYCSAFTRAALGKSLGSKVFNQNSNVINTIQFNKDYNLGPFNVRWIEVFHSIPEASFIYIKHNQHSVLHAADWCANKSNLVEYKEKLSSISADYVVSDVTNILGDVEDISESDLQSNIYNIVKKSDGAIWVVLFASNVDRVQTIAKVASKLGRNIVSLSNIISGTVKSAQTLGIANKDIKILSGSSPTAMNQDRSKLIYLVSGSQGTKGSSLWNAVLGDNKKHYVIAGDDVVFSAKTIPGNYSEVQFLKNKIYNIGANVHAEHNGTFHKSGHAGQSQIIKLLNITKPKVFIPMHGDSMRASKAIEIGKKLKISTFQVPNGDVVNLHDNSADLLFSVGKSKLFPMGNRVFNTESGFAKDLIKSNNSNSSTMFITCICNLQIERLEDIIISTHNILTKEESLDLYSDIMNDVELLDIDFSSLEDVKSTIGNLIASYCTKEFNIHIKTCVHIVCT